MQIKLSPVGKAELAAYKKDMQHAFQMGTVNVFGETDKTVLPDGDIEDSLRKKGAIAYKAVADGETVGGAIVVIDEKTRHNHLDILYVKYGVQSKGIGQAIWKEIERLHPDTEVWETVTPYFEKRNIHFYINRLGFHAVEFFNPMHKSPEIPDDMIGGDYFFRFEKVMNGSARQDMRR